MSLLSGISCEKVKVNTLHMCQSGCKVGKRVISKNVAWKGCLCCYRLQSGRWKGGGVPFYHHPLGTCTPIVRIEEPPNQLNVSDSMLLVAHSYSRNISLSPGYYNRCFMWGERSPGVVVTIILTNTQKGPTKVLLFPITHTTTLSKVKFPPTKAAFFCSRERLRKGRMA